VQNSRRKPKQARLKIVDVIRLTSSGKWRKGKKQRDTPESSRIGVDSPHGREAPREACVAVVLEVAASAVAKPGRFDRSSIRTVRDGGG